MTRINGTTTTRRDDLEYVQHMIRELRDITASHRERTLTYLVEMAYVEVSDLLREDFVVRKPAKAA